jgi:hypothetical protein
MAMQAKKTQSTGTSKLVNSGQHEQTNKYKHQKPRLGVSIALQITKNLK